MEERNGEVHAETDEVRAGSTPNIVRWVLILGLALAIILLSVTWITGAVMVDDTAKGHEVNRAAQDLPASSAAP